jgi:hypothetical protein
MGLPTSTRASKRPEGVGIGAGMATGAVRRRGRSRAGRANRWGDRDGQSSASADHAVGRETKWRRWMIHGQRGRGTRRSFLGAEVRARADIVLARPRLEGSVSVPSTANNIVHTNYIKCFRFGIRAGAWFVGIGGSPPSRVRSTITLCGTSHLRAGGKASSITMNNGDVVPCFSPFELDASRCLALDYIPTGSTAACGTLETHTTLRLARKSFASLSSASITSGSTPCRRSNPRTPRTLPPVPRNSPNFHISWQIHKFTRVRISLVSNCVFIFFLLL